MSKQYKSLSDKQKAIINKQTQPEKYRQPTHKQKKQKREKQHEQLQTNKNHSKCREQFFSSH